MGAGRACVRAVNRSECRQTGAGAVAQGFGTDRRRMHRRPTDRPTDKHRDDGGGALINLLKRKVERNQDFLDAGRQS
jgi:hypothetical protein